MFYANPSYPPHLNQMMVQRGLGRATEKAEDKRDRKGAMLMGWGLLGLPVRLTESPLLGEQGL